MARNSSQTLRAAAVYARTLLAFAESKGQREVLREDVAALTAVFSKTPYLTRAFSLPALSAAKKTQLLKPVVEKASDLLRRLIRLLEIKGRLALLPAICEVFLRLEEEGRNVRRVRVVSATALSAEQLELLSKGLSARRPGKTYLLHNEVDPSLIAGFRMEEDGLVTDTSLRHKLDGLRQRLAAA